MAIRAKEPAMICPGCRGRMSAEDFEPILFTDGLVDVTYMCEWCGTEAKRAIRTSTATVGCLRGVCARPWPAKVDVNALEAGDGGRPSRRRVDASR